MVVGFGTCQLSCTKLGSPLGETAPDCRAFCVAVRASSVGCITADGNPALPASCNTLTVCPLYVKMPCCASGVITQTDASLVPGCFDIAKLPKKNSLFLMMGPPRLPPKSFKMNAFFL